MLLFTLAAEGASSSIVERRHRSSVAGFDLHVHERQNGIAELVGAIVSLPGTGPVSDERCPRLHRPVVARPAARAALPGAPLSSMAGSVTELDHCGALVEYPDIALRGIASDHEGIGHAWLALLECR